ncbi:MAG: HAD family hydrolase [Thermoplasmata archaeon]
MAGPSPPAPRFRLVTFDIDGTLTTVHGWRFLAEATECASEYEASNRGFVAGTIGEDAHLEDLLRLAVGLPLAEVEGILERTPKLGGIAEAIEAWHQRGVRVALLTHNPDYVCAWYARRFGFDGFAGTRTAPVRDGRIPPLREVRADKWAGLLELTARWALPPMAVVHVGDGPADARLFPLVGGGVALNSELPEVDAAADLALKIADLRELPGRIDTMTARRRDSIGR